MNTVCYSQSWEDTNLLLCALKIGPSDTVVSITSGGDNALALLMQRPALLFCVDTNAAQNYLAETKLMAARALSYEAYLAFLGARDSHERAFYFSKVESLLSYTARHWLSENKPLLERGLIHCGRFERYMRIFRKLLSFVHNKSTVEKFLHTESLSEQIAYYNRVWNTWRWRAFFWIATHPFLLRSFARHSGALVHDSDTDDTTYAMRLSKLIHRSHLSKNYYMQYALSGRYGDVLPEYLTEDGYQSIRHNDVTKCSFHTKSIGAFLQGIPDATIQAYNLSDCFEFMSAHEREVLWHDILRTAHRGARVAYWCNQLEVGVPPALKDKFFEEKEIVSELRSRDRLYYYRSFHIYTVSQ